MSLLEKFYDVRFGSERLDASEFTGKIEIIETNGKKIDEVSDDVVKKILDIAARNGYKKLLLSVDSFVGKGETRSFAINTLINSFNDFDAENRYVYAFDWNVDRSIAGDFLRSENIVPMGYSYDTGSLYLEDTDFVDDFEKYVKQFEQGKTYREIILDFMYKKGLDSPDVYNASGISRFTFSKMLNPKQDYNPSLDKLCSVAIGMRLTLDETQYLLNSAHLHLGKTTKRDQVIRYCIEKKIYDIDRVNDCLNCLGLPCLMDISASQK